MGTFLKNLLLFTLVAILFLEGIIRVKHLSSDVPERFVDSFGIQRYKPFQTGYFAEATEPWQINALGWPGIIDSSSTEIISVVGDSYIENFMNPMACHQGPLLKKQCPNYSFFEAARSGVTFIEAMEICHALNTEIAPKRHIVYLSTFDFIESLADRNRFSDRTQISLCDQQIIPGQLKQPGLKKILYSFKLGYYLYLRYPLFVEKQNKAESKQSNLSTQSIGTDTLNALMNYCKTKYALENMLWVFHPGTDTAIIAAAQRVGVRTLSLKEPYSGAFSRNKNDNHWSCEGHQAISEQVAKELMASPLQ